MGPRRIVLVGAISVVAVAAYLLFRLLSAPASGMPTTLVPGVASGYNVLFVSLDTTRADHLGSYGHAGAETPVLDGLAGNGVRFDDAVSVAPVTLPSHASMFTGLYPPGHGVRRNGEYRLGSEQVTLAERLADAGYTTAAFVGAFVLDRRFGLGQGFHTYDDAVTPAGSLALGNTFDERDAAAVTDAALDWMNTRDAGRPFFAWVHYFDPHQPFAAPEPYASRFGDRAYDAEIAYVDSQLGRLLEYLRETGADRKTLVVVVSDHGEGLGDHGEGSHDYFIYESVMRVPFLLSAPALVSDPHVVDDVVVSLVDLLPTVLDLLGVDVPDELDGFSLIRDGAAANRGVYMESLAPYMDYGWAPLFGLRRHGDKYILAPTPEYYDLDDDPAETTNLDPDPPRSARVARNDLRERLDRKLDAWPSLEGVAGSADTMDPETRARLQSLGYAGSTPVVSGDTLADPKAMLEAFNRFDRAKSLGRAGRVPEAIAEMEAVAAMSAGNRMVLAQLARLYVVANRLGDAERVLREFIAIRPTPETLTLLAQVFVATGRLGEAGDLADEALAMDAKHGMSFIVRGDIAARNGDSATAVELYRRANEVDPYRSGPAVQARMQGLTRR